MKCFYEIDVSCFLVLSFFRVFSCSSKKVCNKTSIDRASFAMNIIFEMYFKRLGLVVITDGHQSSIMMNERREKNHVYFKYFNIT